MNELKQLKNFVEMYENASDNELMSKEEQRKEILLMIDVILSNIHHDVSTTVDNVEIVRKIQTMSYIKYDLIKFNDVKNLQVRFYSNHVTINGMTFQI